MMYKSSILDVHMDVLQLGLCYWGEKYRMN